MDLYSSLLSLTSCLNQPITYSLSHSFSSWTSILHTTFLQLFLCCLWLKMLTMTSITFFERIKDICSNSNAYFFSILSLTLMPLDDSLKLEFYKCRFKCEEDIPKVFSWWMITINAIIIIRKVLLEIINSFQSSLVFFSEIKMLKSRDYDLVQILCANQLSSTTLTSFSPINMSLMNLTVQFYSGGR